MRKGRVHRVAGQQGSSSTLIQQENQQPQRPAPRAVDAQPRVALKPRAGVKRSAAATAADGAVKKVGTNGERDMGRVNAPGIPKLSPVILRVDASGFTAGVLLISGHPLSSPSEELF